MPEVSGGISNNIPVSRGIEALKRQENLAGAESPGISSDRKLLDSQDREDRVQIGAEARQLNDDQQRSQDLQEFQREGQRIAENQQEQTVQAQAVANPAALPEQNLSPFRSEPSSSRVTEKFKQSESSNNSKAQKGLNIDVQI
jgi:hypothetical protein